MTQRKVIVRGATNQALDELDAADIPDLSASYDPAGTTAGHTGDTSAAHAASAIAFTPAGSIAATDVQAAIEEVAAEAGGSPTAASVSFTPAGTIAATDVQAAIEEVAAEAGGHAAVTLAADADTLLGLSTQQITLDTQVANKVFAGPATGADADPTFRDLVDADIPAAIARDSEVTSAVSAHAAASDPHTEYRKESDNHSHASSGAQGGTVSHDVLTDVSIDDHHARDHAASHAENAADELLVENLGTASTDTSKVFAPDGTGGVSVVTPPSGVPTGAAIVALTALTPTTDDLVVAVDDPAGTPATKKLSILSLLALAVSNVVVQVKTSGSGTYTPTANMKKVLVICVGGGGGTPAETVADAAVGGGGGGGCAIKLFSAADIGASQPYTVGAASTTGGNTSGLGTANALLQATGGGVGASTGLTTTLGTPSAAAAGGIGTLGDLNFEGGPGKRGFVWSTSNAIGGDGGDSFLGAGGRGGSGAGAEAGAGGRAYGGGAGGGATSTGGDIAAASGAAGIMYFIEFIG